MTDSSNDINAKINEYHLMIEEVLGGMDMMLAQLNKRISLIENTLKTPKIEALEVPNHEVDLLREEMKQLKGEMMDGFNLAFKKIHERK